MASPFRKVYQVPGTPEQIWDAFLDEKTIEKWLVKDNSEMEDREGFKFKWEIPGQRMEGEVKDLRLHKEIVLKWRREEWDENHFATVTIQMNEMSNGTRLEIKVTHIPETEWDEVYEYWDQIVVRKLEKYLEKINKKKR